MQVRLQGTGKFTTMSQTPILNSSKHKLKKKAAMDTPTDNQHPPFTVTPKGSYLFIQFYERLSADVMAAETDAVAEMSKKTGIKATITDIRDVTYQDITLGMQIKGMSLIWKVRHIRMAFLVRSGELQKLVRSTFHQLHLDHRCGVFDDEASAANWIQQEEQVDKDRETEEQSKS